VIITGYGRYSFGALPACTRAGQTDCTDTLDPIQGGGVEWLWPFPGMLYPDVNTTPGLKSDGTTKPSSAQQVASAASSVLWLGLAAVATYLLVK